MTILRDRVTRYGVTVNDGKTGTVLVSNLTPQTIGRHVQNFLSTGGTGGTGGTGAAVAQRRSRALQQVIDDYREGNIGESSEAVIRALRTRLSEAYGYEVNIEMARASYLDIQDQLQAGLTSTSPTAAAAAAAAAGLDPATSGYLAGQGVAAGDPDPGLVTGTGADTAVKIEEAFRANRINKDQAEARLTALGYENAKDIAGYWVTGGRGTTLGGYLSGAADKDFAGEVTTASPNLAQIKADYESGAFSFQMDIDARTSVLRVLRNSFPGTSDEALNAIIASWTPFSGTGAPPPAPAPVGAGVTSQQAALNTIITRFRRGDFANKADVIRAIQSSLGVTPNEALALYASIESSDLEMTDAGEMRRELLGVQDRESVMRRAGLDEFGRAMSFGATGRLYDTLANRFNQIDPVMGFFDQSALDPSQRLRNRFQSFMASPPSADEIRDARDRILLQAQGGTEGSELVEAAFTQGAETDPSFRRFLPAFQAAMQPTLAQVNPSLQSPLLNRLQDQYRNLYAQDPTTFGSAQDVFERFKGFGGNFLNPASSDELAKLRAGQAQLSGNPFRNF